MSRPGLLMASMKRKKRGGWFCLDIRVVDLCKTEVLAWTCLRRGRASGMQSNGSSVIVDRGVLRLASAVCAWSGSVLLSA